MSLHQQLATFSGLFSKEVIDSSPWNLSEGCKVHNCLENCQKCAQRNFMNFCAKTPSHSFLQNNNSAALVMCTYDEKCNLNNCRKIRNLLNSSNSRGILSSFCNEQYAAYLKETSFLFILRQKLHFSPQKIFYLNKVLGLATKVTFM